jgi:hypothetical protein
VSPGKHGPNRLGSYLVVHDTHMDQVVRGGFVSSHDLVVSFSGESSISIEGTIVCAGGIVIDVRKTIGVLEGRGPGALVQTRTYSYNVRILGTGNVFRYDSPDPGGEFDDAPAHHTEHHVHRYDVFSGDRRGTVECIYDIEQVPTLREVIDAAADW